MDNPDHFELIRQAFPECRVEEVPFRNKMHYKLTFQHPINLHDYSFFIKAIHIPLSGFAYMFEPLELAGRLIEEDTGCYFQSPEALRL